MNKPPPVINISLPDPLKHFARNHPAWKLAALVAVLGAWVTVVYFVTH